jgi:hypothetical protein
MIRKKVVVKECKCCQVPDEVKKQVTSCIHRHPAAKTFQKKYMVVMKFLNLESLQFDEICGHCQGIIIGGAAAGKNWE